MNRTGTLSIDPGSGESRLDGTLLAIQGAQDPLGEATNFLANHNLFNNEPATVTGNDGPLGTEQVFFMTDAVAAAEQPLAFNLIGGAVKSVKKAAGKKTAKKVAGKKSTKKSAAKKSATSRHGSSKKSAKRASKKGARK